MEKYGVSTGDDLVKTATEDKLKKCPICSTPVRPPDVTGVLLCPNCGTRPFEAGNS